MQALIFDCDGVLVDTERDGHRVAFNQAFAELGLQTEWSVERYGELLHLGRVLRVTGRISQDVERGVGVAVLAVAELPLRGEVAVSAGGFDPWWSSEAG